MASKKRKVLVITGTRAEFGYLRPVLAEISKSKKLSLRLLVTGMHTLRRFGNTRREVAKEFPVAETVAVGERDSMLQALGKEIAGIERYCRRERPDLMLVIADRDEGFAGAIVAGHLGIPLAHLSGGSTSGRGVDEAIRHSISKFAHAHFAWTAQNGKRLRAMGEEPWRVHVSGSTAFDTLRQVPLMSRRALAKELGLGSLPWIIVVQHPVPLDTTPLRGQLAPTLRAAARFDAERIIVYPNSDTGHEGFVRAIKKLKGARRTHVYKNIPHRAFLSLMRHAQVLVGNSSSGIEEAGYFKLPVVDIGGRQNGREHGANVLHAPYDAGKIARAIRAALSPQFARKARAAKHPYYRGNASKKIAGILERLPLDDKLRYKKIPM